MKLKAVFLLALSLFLTVPMQPVEASVYDHVSSVVEVRTYSETSTGDYWASGTGFFISWDGAIVTNYDVIQDNEGNIADVILICTVEDEYSTPDCKYTAYALAYDINRDLALLFPMQEIDEEGNLVAEVSTTFVTEHYLDISNLLPQLSEDIFILGFPGADLSDSITLTEGIVSGFSGNWFLTDATINPGNSGGPVFSYYDEEVVGVASIVTTSGVGGNYGYAISNQAIYDWFNELVGYGILNGEFVDEMFSDETGYNTGEVIFSDVKIGEPNAEAIASLKDAEIIGGYPDGSFKPARSLNRAELLKILVEGAGYTPSETEYKNCFPDVGTDWYAKYVCFAKEEGWIQGYPDNTFRPAQNVNKVEAIKMMLEVFDVELIEAGSELFEDVNASEWYSNYIQTAKSWGLLEEEGLYWPGSDITRGGVAENLYRLLAALYN